MKLENVFSEIDKDKENFIEVLNEIIRIPSISAQKKGIECADKLISLIKREIGFNTKKFETPGYPIVYAEKTVNAPVTLIFYNHYDVQDPFPLDKWDSPPFELTQKDNFLYGRGVSDNKGNLIARIFAIKIYQSIFGKLPLNVKFIIEGEEEVGSPHLPDFIRNYPELIEGDFCIWESGHRNASHQQQVWLGVKGILYLNLEIKASNRDIHSSWGGVIENPAWNLTWALNSLKNKEQKILIKGFYDNVLEPSEKEIELLKNIPFNEKLYKNNFGIKSFTGSGIKLKSDYYFTPTLNIDGLDSGYKGMGAKTIIPSTAKAKIDFRLVPNQNPNEILQKFEEHLRVHGFHQINITSFHGYPPARTSIASPYLKIISRTGENVYKKPLVVHPTKAGSGPMYLFSNRMDCFALGCGYERSNNHAPNENISIEDFLLNMKHFTALFHYFNK